MCTPKPVTSKKRKCVLLTVKNELKFMKLSEKAKTPTKGTPFSAGFDLYSAENITISPWEHKLIKTDIQIKLPPGSYGHILPRSGLALDHWIGINGGVIGKKKLFYKL